MFDQVKKKQRVLKKISNVTNLCFKRCKVAWPCGWSAPLIQALRYAVFKWDGCGSRTEAVSSVYVGTGNSLPCLRPSLSSGESTVCPPFLLWALAGVAPRWSCVTTPYPALFSSEWHVPSGRRESRSDQRL